MSETKQHLDTVSHDYIRYANVWEDADLLIEKLGITEGDKVLSIASAGDNALACLAMNPSLVVAVDLNKPQLYLTELKRETIRHLSREECLQFLGFEESEKRMQLYQRIRPTLSDLCKQYWDVQVELIGNGLVHEGKFEKYLSLFAKKVLPWIHKTSTVDALFIEKSDLEQSEFYKKNWDTWRWRALFKIFFSKTIMGWLGRDPAFLKQVETNVGQEIYSRAKRHLSSADAQRNPILRYCLTGSYDGLLPKYLQTKSYTIIKANIDRLSIIEGYAQDAGKQFGKFDRFNLSNIFEYMPTDIFQQTIESLDSIASPDATFGYWNLLVERVISNQLPHFQSAFRNIQAREYDSGFFYRELIVDQKVEV